MQISTAFNDMHTASQKLYKAAADYRKAKNDLAKRFVSNLDKSVKDERLIKGQIEAYRKTDNAKYYKGEREKMESQRRAAFNQARADFKAASENLQEAVKAFQPAFDVSDKKLQDALNVARIGKDLPEEAVRNLLLSLRTNKTNFEVVKSALQRGGVNPDYIRGIYPFDGEVMQYDYDVMVDDVCGRSSDPYVYASIASLENRLINDGAAFGVDLSPIVSKEDKEAANDARVRRVMALPSFDDAAALDYL